MRHIFIIFTISLLLLTSPLFGQSLNGFFETKMVEMLSFLSKNCGKIDGIHPNPSQSDSLQVKSPILVNFPQIVVYVRFS